MLCDLDYILLNVQNYVQNLGYHSEASLEHTGVDMGSAALHPVIL